MCDVLRVSVKYTLDPGNLDVALSSHFKQKGCESLHSTTNPIS